MDVASAGSSRARCIAHRAGAGFRRRFCSSLLVAILAATAAVHAPHAAAQATKSRSAPAPQDDLRAVQASAADAAEGKRAAEANCTRCHGANGISAIKGVPHLAGQRPSYLYGKMRAYQTGARASREMEAAVKFLSDDALVKIAAFYGSLEPAQPSYSSRAAKRGGPPAKADPVAAGKASATASCSGCHGESGVSATAGTPSLVGLDPKYFAAALAAYKGGQRKHEVMQSLSASLNDADVNNMALYYGLQKAARATTPVQGDAAAGKAAAGACAGCHGEQGVSTNPAVPSLAGQEAQYHVAALRAYKEGTRKDETMKGVASDLSERAMKDLAAFYAGLEPRAPKVDKPLTLAEWVQRCDRCHGIAGNSIDVHTPALASQRPEYLERALLAYRAGERKDSIMAAMSATLTDGDIKAIASYYAQQRARAFVFVPVPSR